MLHNKKTTNSVRKSQHITGAKRRTPPAPPPPSPIKNERFLRQMNHSWYSLALDKTSWATKYIAGHCNQINTEQEIYYIEILNTKLLLSNFYLQVESSADKYTGYHVTFASYNNLSSVGLWLNN